MKTTRRRVWVVGSGLATMSVLVCLYALHNANAQEASAKVEKDDTITPRAAIKIAVGKVPGRALLASYEDGDGKWTYNVMIVTRDKEIKKLEIDPVTGKIIGDVETVDPDAEGKDLTNDLNQALKEGVPSDAKPDGDKKDEKPDKP